jgi:predicted nuclease with TOPRIM domain
MAIPIFSEIEKLINEHGSAVILKERLGLAQDKYASLASENTALKAEIAVLKAENEALKLDNTQLKEQRKALEDELSDKRKKELEEERNFVHGLEPPDQSF